MDSGTVFNKLWVIESLRQGELKTGKNLVENQLVDAKRNYPDLIVAYEQPGTKEQLLRLLGRIRDETRSAGLYPMIHFECHGCRDGLAVANGESVTWDELRQALIEINHACRLNLVVVLAACNGAHLIKVATKPDRAPFWAVIGPKEEITAGDAERDFGAFYATFFKTLDGDAAIAGLNGGVGGSGRKYHFLGAAGLFVRAYGAYYRDHCVGKARRRRVEDLVSQVLVNPDVRRRGVSWARKNIKEMLRAQEAYFDKMKNLFFFIDCFPDNAARFPLRYSDLLEKVRS